LVNLTPILGTHFYTGSNLGVDHGGVHINSGIQNHWFYILANGANNTNDNGDYYHVTGIGMDDAAEIAYLALTSHLMSASQFTDSRMATIQAAIHLFGYCSQQHKSTVDAWYAVGLGSHSGCPPLSINETSKFINIYPNPTNSVFSISTQGLHIQGNIRVYDINGKLVKSIKPIDVTKISVSDLSSGIYVVRVMIDDRYISKKLILHDRE